MNEKHRAKLKIYHCLVVDNAKKYEMSSGTMSSN